MNSEISLDFRNIDEYNQIMQCIGSDLRYDHLEDHFKRQCYEIFYLCFFMNLTSMNPMFICLRIHEYGIQKILALQILLGFQEVK